MNPTSIFYELYFKKNISYLLLCAKVYRRPFKAFPGRWRVVKGVGRL